MLFSKRNLIRHVHIPPGGKCSNYKRNVHLKLLNFQLNSKKDKNFELCVLVSATLCVCVCVC